MMKRTKEFSKLYLLQPQRSLKSSGDANYLVHLTFLYDTTCRHPHHIQPQDNREVFLSFMYKHEKDKCNLKQTKYTGIHHRRCVQYIPYQSKQLSVQCYSLPIKCDLLFNEKFDPLFDFRSLQKRTKKKGGRGNENQGWAFIVDLRLLGIEFVESLHPKEHHDLWIVWPSRYGQQQHPPK